MPILMQVLVSLSLMCVICLNTQAASKQNKKKKRDPVRFSQLDPQDTTISLLEIKRGMTIHSYWGHIIFRIKNKKAKVDETVDWGVFNSKEKNFVYKFAVGDLPYRASFKTTAYRIAKYKKEKRSVWEQKINFTDLQKQKLFSILDHWQFPKPKSYDYHLMFNNCSTMIRDILHEVLGKGFKDHLSVQSKETLRDLGAPPYYNHPVLAFVPPLLYNSIIDYDLQHWEFFFLPKASIDLLHKTPAFDDRGVAIPNTKLLKNSFIITQGGRYADVRYHPFLYLTTFWLVLLFISVVLYFNKRYPSLLIRVFSFCSFTLFAFSSFVSIIMVVAWVLTSHDYVYNNANLFIYWPVDLLLVYSSALFMLKGCVDKNLKVVRWSRYLLISHGVFLILIFALKLFGVVTQDLSHTFSYYLVCAIPTGFLFYRSMTKEILRLTQNEG